MDSMLYCKTGAMKTRFKAPGAGNGSETASGPCLQAPVPPAGGNLQGVGFAVGQTAEASSTSGLWGFFDKTYCISLVGREDRRREAERQFRAVGLAGRVEFVIVKKHPVDNERGIYESHQECFRRGIAAGARNMLVFEDDILFDRFSTRVLSDCVRFLASHDDWKLFFFGCLTSGSRKTANASVLRVRYRSLTHAYAIQRSVAERLLRLPWGRRPFDAVLSSLGKEYFAAYPSFAFQSNARTDNMRLGRLDRWRRICGGLLRIQKMDEFYHRNQWTVVGVHVLLILILLKLIAG